MLFVRWYASVSLSCYHPFYFFSFFKLSRNQHGTQEQ